MTLMLYAPPPLFGLARLRVEPVVVEVLENPAVRSDGKVLAGMARIRVAVPKDALINLLARIPVEERQERVVERVVIAADLKPLLEA